MTEQLRGPFEKFVDSPYYCEPELRGGAGDGLFFGVPPLASDALLTTLSRKHKRSNKVSPRNFQKALVLHRCTPFYACSGCASFNMCRSRSHIRKPICAVCRLISAFGPFHETALQNKGKFPNHKRKLHLPQSQNLQFLTKNQRTHPPPPR
jgi:hypothetical protein